METKEWFTRDKTGWPRGPWDTEPDKIQWPDVETGLPCLIVRNNVGALCGYVGSPAGHPWYGLDYDAPEPYPDVHGGLTFADRCQDEAPEGHGICHIAGPGEPDDVWWLGFDTAHCGDHTPLLRLFPGDTYKNVEYVKDQCAQLAKAISAAAGGGAAHR